jgi:predicted phage terminase large subunit-like protein
MIGSAAPRVISPVESLKADLLEPFYRDRWYAHQLLFQHRHRDRSARVHRELVLALNAAHARQSIEGFRGLGKSTYVEETAVLKAIFQEFRFLLIVGASLTRAAERLYPIKIELLQNESLLALTGALNGDVWRDDKITLKNGVAIQAMGRDQSMTGIKHNDYRPDAVIIDDVEDPEEVRTDEQRAQTWNWLLKVLLPALDHPDRSWVRHLGTRRGSGSLPERLEQAGWPVAKFPIEYLGQEGERRATWPAKFPLSAIDERRRLYAGDLETYLQEYMCEATSAAARVFARETMRFEARRRDWHAVYVMYDPARTTHKGSATTGKAVWSWLGRRLYIWELRAERWAPDEIVADILETNERWRPTWIGVEKTGLNEWIMQPLRQASRGRILPLKGVEAPRGKLDFIRTLQPFFASGEVVFIGEEEAYREAIQQFQTFPRGRIDAPNALAYAVLLRSGQPVYDGFSDENIVGDPGQWGDDNPLFFAAHHDGSVGVAVLCRRNHGQLCILADFVREGSPGDIVGDIAADAALVAGARRTGQRTIWGEGEDLYKLPLTIARSEAVDISWVVPPIHFERWRNTGLVQAIRQIPAKAQQGGEPLAGRSQIADLITRRPHGEPGLVVSERASWTLRALAGGYARPLGRRGMAEGEAEQGVYRLLMEAVESFVGVGVATPSDETVQPIAYTKGGVAYRSAIPQR